MNVILAKANISFAELSHIVKNPNSYYKESLKVTKKKDKAGNFKTRKTEVPCPKLKLIHKILKNELNNIKMPDYVMATKGRGHVLNAQQHIGSKFLLNMDIANFYPSSRSDYVFRFFCDQLEMPADIAKFVTGLVVYNQHIPTGSPISTVLTYLMHKDLFDEIFNLSYKNNIKFSLYIDDMSFSSNLPIPLWFRANVNKIIKKHNLKIKKSKTKAFGSNRVKSVTGVEIALDNTLKAPYKLTAKLFGEEFIKIKKNGVQVLSDKELMVLMGYLCSVRSIEHDAYPTLYNTLISEQRRRQKKVS
ncbi:MAG: reverse transcriptase family protein [Bdellovibrionaceae bacterium]|nr:reverse transcriptase family protein [Pseudobdellovibrionaceae bacterium]